jgi:F-type H+-transporting ATPase subunit b
MRALLIAIVSIVLGAAGTAHAQESESEKVGSAVEPNVSGDHGAEPGGHEEDPTTWFRFFGNPFGHYGKDVAGGKFGDGVQLDPKTGVEEKTPEEEPMSPPFIFMVLNFVLLLWILAKYGKPPIQKLAADRHDQIKSALEEAAKLRQQAADKLDEYQGKLKQADSEITKMVEGMRADAEADKKRILENAERQAVQMKRDAETRIAAEIELARTVLTREVTAAAIAATEQLLREKMTSADHQQVIGTFIAGVQNHTGKEAS